MVDKWTPKPVEFRNLEEGRAALQNERLLDDFFDRWSDILDAVDAAGQIKCSTDFARRLPEQGINVLLVGETGAGKSMLVKVVTGDESILTSATQAETSEDKRYSSPCRIHWIDTPGFKLPLSLEEAHKEQQNIFQKLRDKWWWRAWKNKITSRLSSKDLTLRPLIMVYCHRASSRIIPGPMDEIFGLAHAQQVPLIVALTDVCSIDDSDLRKVRDELCVLAGDYARVVEINSEQKTVRGHQHKVTGVKQLLESILDALRPIDALHLLEPAWYLPSDARTKTTLRRHPSAPLGAERGHSNTDASGGQCGKGRVRASSGAGIAGSPSKKRRTSSVR